MYSTVCIQIYTVYSNVCMLQLMVTLDLGVDFTERERE